MISAHAYRPRLGALVLVLCCSWLAGCAGIQLKKVGHEDPAGANGYVEFVYPQRDMLTVFRGGKALPARIPLQLQTGDEIETGADAGAVIRFENGSKVILGPRTRVLLGSLEVLFGRLLADLRGLFSAEDETLVAGVEGTRFMFESKRGGRTRVVVLDGIVNCSSKTDSRPMTRLGGAEAFTLSYDSPGEPHSSRVSRAELSKIERWASAMRTAPRAGFCCVGGKVALAHSDSFAAIFRARGTRQGATVQPVDFAPAGRYMNPSATYVAGDFRPTRPPARRAASELLRMYPQRLIATVSRPCTDRRALPAHDRLHRFSTSGLSCTT